MKRTLLALASLTAILLLSCNSIENSSASSEDLDFSQTPTLQKIIPIDEAQATCYSKKYTPTTPQTMTVFITTSGASDYSGEMTFSGPSTLPTNATITNIEAYTGRIDSYNGAVLTNHLKIRKGLVYTTIPWGGAAGQTLTTHDFDGLPARDTYYVSFNATCVGFGTSIAKICSKTYSGVTLTIHYCVP
jgi:hypothetical protein